MKMDATCVLPQVDEARCTLCGLCVEVCPCHAVELGEQGPFFTCPETCPGPPICAETLDCCDLCEEVCPTGALTCAFEIVLEADQSGDKSAESHKSQAPGGQSLG